MNWQLKSHNYDPACPMVKTENRKLRRTRPKFIVLSQFKPANPSEGPSMWRVWMITGGLAIWTKSPPEAPPPEGGDADG